MQVETEVMVAMEKTGALAEATAVGEVGATWVGPPAASAAWPVALVVRASAESYQVRR